MREEAFKVLGIVPTLDQHEIREAFVRLARIFHPDRFAGMPDDVVAEAESRMKAVSEAYGLLRTSKKEIRLPPPAPWSSNLDLLEEVRRFREMIEAQRAQDEQDRKRWAHWAELEKQARERVAWESQFAAALAEDLGGRTDGASKQEAPVLELASGEPVKASRRPATPKKPPKASRRPAAAKTGRIASRAAGRVRVSSSSNGKGSSATKSKSSSVKNGKGSPARNGASAKNGKVRKASARTTKVSARR